MFCLEWASTTYVGATGPCVGSSSGNSLRHLGPHRMTYMKVTKFILTRPMSSYNLSMRLVWKH